MNGRHDLPVPVQVVSSRDDLGRLDRDQVPSVVIGVHGAGRTLAITIHSDDSRVLSWAVQNWGPPADVAPSSSILILRGGPADYGVAGALRGARWWDPERRWLVQFDSVSYALVKIAVRAICSLDARSDELFVHGCAFAVGDAPTRGVLLIGSSGAGKTTVISRMLAGGTPPVRVVNDDWGVVDLGRGVARNTGELRLHMKALSVLAFRPDLLGQGLNALPREGPENPDSPQMRVLVEPESVFTGRTAEEVEVTDVIFVTRGVGIGAATGPEATLDLLLTGAYSEYYRRHETFFNGSLVLPDAEAVRAERAKYQKLLARARVRWVANAGTRDDLFSAFLAALA